jgi:hypothetical protein
MSSHHRQSCNTNATRPGYEEESPAENYYSRDYDDYSPSPPHASGGSYFPQNNEFPPPPVNPTGFTHHANQSSPNVAQPPIPPYNPADYANQPPPPHDGFGYPPEAPRGDNVSPNNQYHNPAQPPVPPPTATSAPYFPPPPQEPRTADGASEL